jgi:hypothetical protein
LRKFIKPINSAGAAITCGISQGDGMDRRIITDDFPGLAVAVATLVKFAASEPDRLATKVPAYRWHKTCWVPSGMIETHQQLRELAQRARQCPKTMKVDTARWRKRKSVKMPLSGPCIFGCPTSTKSTALARTRERWHKVPHPSPWPGVRAGEVLCMKCYNSGVVNPRTRKRKLQQLSGAGQVVLKVGQQYRLRGLRNRSDLNGKLVSLLYMPDDGGRVTVAYCDSMLRVHLDHLAHPAELLCEEVAMARATNSAGEDR